MNGSGSGHSSDSVPTSARRPVGFGRGALGVLAVLLSVAAVTGCGSGRTGDVAATPSAPARPSPVSSPTLAPSPTLASSATNTATPSARPSGGVWSAAGASFGVDRAEWPGTAAAAHAGLQDLPTERRGVRRELVFSPADADEGFGAVAHLTYGEVSVDVSQEYLTTDLDDTGTLQLFSANNLLAAQFGLGLACAKGSYHGTMPQMKDYPGPSGTKKPLTRDVWFSCKVDGAEGDESYRAHAVGWTSDKTAWLALAPDEKAVRALVVDLHDALA